MLHLFFFLSDLSNDIASQIAIGVIFGLLFLVILVLAIILLVFYIRGPRKHKAVRILEPKDEKIKKKKSETIFSNSSTDSPTKDEKEKKKNKKTKKKRKKVKQITDINQNLSLRRTESMMKDRKEKVRLNLARLDIPFKEILNSGNYEKKNMFIKETS